MAVHFTGAYLLGYNQTNNFFGDNLFRYGSTANMTISAYIDVRPRPQYGYDNPNLDNLGVKEAFQIINDQASNIENWQPITIHTGDLNDPGYVIATGRVNSINQVRPNPVRVGEYVINIETPISGGQEAFNMKGPSNQTTFENAFPSQGNGSIQQVFSESGAVFENFSEQFNFSIGEDNSYEYEQSLNMKLISGDHLVPDPIQTSKDVAQAIFNVAPSDVPAFGFIDEQFSGFYAKTTTQQGEAWLSGVKYFSESYDLINLNCTFSKKCKLNSELKEKYSVEISHSLTLDNIGIVNITENGSIKSTTEEAIATRYQNVRDGIETQINGAYDRCNDFYNDYLPSGWVDPDYAGTRSVITEDDAQALFTKAITVGRNYQPNLATAQYTTAFVNHLGIYNTTSGIHEFTQTSTENKGGIITVEENGKITPYLEYNEGKYANKNVDFFKDESTYGQVGIYSDQFKSDISARANSTYAGYKAQQKYEFLETVTDGEGKIGLAAPSLVPISKNVSIPRYGISIDYSHTFSDDPSLLKTGEKLYLKGFRKFSISKDDTLMLPHNNEYTIPGLKRNKKKYPYQIVHDGTQTQLGNRGFSIQGFMARPISNTLDNPAVWSMSTKLDAVKSEISQSMADVVSDIGLDLNHHDIFIKDVSFSFTSNGEFSSNGNIAFVHIGGVKYNTLGELLE
jgi:hypothetical protein